MHGVQIVYLWSWNIGYGLLLHYKYVHFAQGLSASTLVIRLLIDDVRDTYSAPA